MVPGDSLSALSLSVTSDEPGFSVLSADEVSLFTFSVVPESVLSDSLLIEQASVVSLLTSSVVSESVLSDSLDIELASVVPWPGSVVGLSVVWAEGPPLVWVVGMSLVGVAGSSVVSVIEVFGTPVVCCIVFSVV